MACTNVKVELQGLAKSFEGSAEAEQARLDAASFAFASADAFVTNAEGCKATLVAAEVVPEVIASVDAFILPYAVARDAASVTITDATAKRNQFQALADNYNAAADVLV